MVQLFVAIRALISLSHSHTCACLAVLERAQWGRASLSKRVPSPSAASDGVWRAAKEQHVVRGWQCAWMVLCLGCAGDLRDPERFDFLLDASGTTGTTKDASTSMPADAAGTTEAPSCATAIFAAKCASIACHGAGAAQVDLVSPGVAARVIDQPSAENGLCKGRTLVATDGSASLLADKLLDAPPCGAKMPAVGSLTMDEQTCLSGWLDTVGAKE